jgi:ferredoxin-NAD(P)+ reductase (naphthalene dioxygenase ferredoxin-specific)
MNYSVKIGQHDTPVAVEMGQTILEAALAQGVPYPHGCRSGNCGACKSRLISGDVEMSPHSEFALTGEEKAQGLILACRAVPWEDVEIEWLGEDEVIAHPLRKLTCRVASVDTMTHDIKRVRLDVLAGGPYLFSAGQFASVTFDGQPARDYSMANLPADPVLEFHIREVPGGAVSTYVQNSLAVGDEVRVEGPFGASWLRDTHRGPILALAGGSGLAPIKSIVEQALSLGMEQDIHLYFGVRDERDLYLEDHFEDLCAKYPNLTFTPVLSDPSGTTARRPGFLHEAVKRDFDDLDGAKVYLAGPPPMVEAASLLAQELGLRQADIHADAFYTEAEKAELEKQE